MGPRPSPQRTLPTEWPPWPVRRRPPFDAAEGGSAREKVEVGRGHREQRRGLQKEGSSTEGGGEGLRRDERRQNFPWRVFRGWCMRLSHACPLSCAVIQTVVWRQRGSPGHKNSLKMLWHPQAPTNINSVGGD